MTDKIIMSDWKAETKVAKNLKVNDYEVEMNNIVCSNWLKEISSASM